MNEIMYADNYSRQFQAQDEFFDCLKAIGRRSRWERKRLLHNFEKRPIAWLLVRCIDFH